MKVKTTGAEFKRFYADPKYWPDGVWHDDDVVVVNGVHDSEADLAIMDDAASVMIESGYVISADDSDLGELAAYFKKWQREQSHVSVLVEVGKADAGRLAEFVKQVGGKVLA